MQPLRSVRLVLGLTLLVVSGCAAGASTVAPVAEPGTPRFRIYTSDGEPVEMRDLLARVREVDAVLVGEEHDDVTGHLVELAILGASHRSVAAPAGRPLTLSLEMFERDVQPVVDEYMAGLITEEHFLAGTRPWDRYETDYKPMVEYARGEGLQLVAANAPRRYVNRVSRLGRAALADMPTAAKALLPPLPYPGPSEAYSAQWNALMSGMGSMTAAAPDSAPADSAPADSAPAAPAAPEGGVRHSSGPAAGAAPSMANVFDAQVLWDASMAESIARALDARPGGLVIHYAGAFHVEQHTGIPEQLLYYRPQTRILTVTMQPTADVGTFVRDEHAGLADFVILTHRR